MGRKAFGLTKKRACDFKKCAKTKQEKPKSGAAGAMHDVPPHERMFK